jgi:hypothetical protein
MKGKVLQHYHLLLVENRIQEFEPKLSSQFLISFGKLLPLHYSYTDWLVLKLRPIRNKIDSLGEPPYQTRYRLVIFRIQDFLKFQNPMVKSTNYYQLKKVKHFFNELQRNSLVTSFTDSQFRSLVTIPEVRVSKSKKQNNSLIARVWIAEELFYYNYPFILPDFFRNKNTKDEFQVQFEIRKVFSSVSIQKEVFVKEFLDSYSSVLSNQRRTKIKKLFIQLVGRLKQNDLIESNYRVFSNGL